MAMDENGMLPPRLGPGETLADQGRNPMRSCGDPRPRAARAAGSGEPGQVQFTAEFQSLLDFPQAPKLAVFGNLRTCTTDAC